MSQCVHKPASLHKTNHCFTRVEVLAIRKRHNMQSLQSGANMRKVRTIVRAQSVNQDVGVREIIGSPQLPDLDPFLALGEFGSDQVSDHSNGFPEHPHRGFETVTYMLLGHMRHRDNQGNSGLLRAGGVQWMTAGRGIIHAEMPEQEDGLMWAFQLWVNLPARAKMTAPRYQDIPPESIPVVDTAEGVRFKVIAGAVSDTTGPVTATDTEPLFLDVRMQPGATYTVFLPVGHNAFAYVYAGTIDIGTPQQRLTTRELAVLDPAGDSVHLAAANSKPARLLLVAGRPLGEPIVRYGPFVMNTDEEIQQAIEDYQSGHF